MMVTFSYYSLFISVSHYNISNQIVHIQSWKVYLNTVFDSVKYATHPIYFRNIADGKYTVVGKYSFFKFQSKNNEEI